MVSVFTYLFFGGVKLGGRFSGAGRTKNVKTPLSWASCAIAAAGPASRRSVRKDYHLGGGAGMYPSHA